MNELEKCVRKYQLDYPRGERTILELYDDKVVEKNFFISGDSYTKEYSCPIIHPRRIFSYLIEVHNTIFDVEKLIVKAYDGKSYSRGPHREIY